MQIRRNKIHFSASAITEGSPKRKDVHTLTDDQIINLFLARDERAVQAVSERYSAACLRTANRYLHSHEDAEECVSDVLMKLWQQIPPAKPQNLEAFIMTLTQHTALDRIRKQQAQKRGGGQAAASLEDVGETLRASETVEDAISRLDHACAQKRGSGTAPLSLDEIGSTVPASDGVEDIIQHRLLTEAVERFLDTLSDDAQTIFTERWHNETQPRDIAEKFGISGVHVRKSLMQTRRKLKAYLKKEGLL